MAPLVGSVQPVSPTGYIQTEPVNLAWGRGAKLGRCGAEGWPQGSLQVGLEALRSRWGAGEGIEEEGLGCAPVSFLGGCVSLGKLLRLSGPQFLLLKMSVDVIHPVVSL